jgi:hypothetical protein
MVCIDTVGVGVGVFDRLVELKKELDDYGLPKIAPPVQLVSVNVAEKVPERSVQQLGVEARPYRLRDYLWLEMSRWLREEEPSFAGLGPEVAQDLAGDLASVRFAIDSSGRTVSSAGRILLPWARFVWIFYPAVLHTWGSALTHHPHVHMINSGQRLKCSQF